MPETTVAQRPIAQVYVKVDGAPVPEGLLEDAVRVLVDCSLHLPDVATLDLHNPNLRWTEGTFKFEVGKTLVVETGERDHKREVFNGEITGIELDANEEGVTTAVVTAYDKAHRLHRGRKTRTFLKATDSDIVKKVANEAGLTPDIAPTTTRHEWVIQHNQTDFEFITERAARNGYYVVASGGKLVCGPMNKVKVAEQLTLAWQKDLLSFRARLTTGDQVNEVEVRGWDPKQKKDIVGLATRPEQTWSNGMSKTGGQTAQQAFAAAKMVVVRESIPSVDDANKFAQALLDEIESNFVTIEARALGNPVVRIGTTVKIDGVGAQFSGTYFVTDARHIYEQGGYNIEFKATGHRSTDMLTLITQGAPRAVHVLNGIVTANNDPENLGRVKVKFPQISSQEESHWCRLAAVGAGAERGIFYLPEVNDEVLVIGQHMDDLYVVGGLWHNVDKPPETNAAVLKASKVFKRVIKSRTGHVISIDDSDDGGNISIIDSSGKNKVIIDTKAKSLELVAEQDITIKAGRNLTVESKIGATQFKAGTEFKVESQSAVNIQTQGQLSLTGTATASLKSNGMTEVKGSMVNVGQ